MNLISRMEGQEIRVDLKYCERCGGLWLRPRGVGGVYCANCRIRLAAISDSGTATVGKGRRRETRARATEVREEGRSRPGLITCSALPRSRYGYDKQIDDGHTRVGSDGASGPAAIGSVWGNGNGPVALPQAQHSTIATLCQGVGRGGKTAILVGAGVLPDAGYVIDDEELRRCRDLRSGHGACDR